MSTESETYHDDIKAILQALNISDCARPYSCHDVVHKDIIPEIRRMIGTCSSLAGMLLEEGYTESAYKILKMIGKDGKRGKMRTDLVLIEWLDSSQPISEWRYLTNLPEAKVIECASVGWLIYEDEKVTMLAPNMGDVDSEENMQASGIILISTKSITEIKKLSEKE